MTVVNETADVNEAADVNKVAMTAARYRTWFWPKLNNEVISS